MSIDPAFGSAYLLAPIAAVVIAGASLSGGLASATSTWVAALALTLLTQMLVIMGLSAAMQYIVFGVAIIAGMVVSGDRVAAAARPVASSRSRRLPSRRRLGVTRSRAREAIDAPTEGVTDETEAPRSLALLLSRPRHDRADRGRERQRRRQAPTSGPSG